MEATASLPQAGTIYTRLSGVFEFQLKCSLFGMELSARLCLEGPRKAYIFWHGADEDMQSSTQVSGLCILLMSSYVVVWYLDTFVGRRSVFSPHVHLEQARRMSRRSRHGVYRCDNLGITFAEASSTSHAFVPCPKNKKLTYQQHMGFSPRMLSIANVDHASNRP